MTEGDLSFSDISALDIGIFYEKFLREMTTSDEGYSASYRRSLQG